MMLEQEVVLVCNSTDSSENSAVHEVVGIRAETIDDVVIIPDVDLGNLAVGSRKWLVAIPLHVVVEVVLVALIAHLLVKGKFASLVGVSNICPGLQRPIDSYTVIVNLITSANHDMEWFLFVHADNIIPESWSRPSIDISADAEAIARMEENAH